MDFNFTIESFPSDAIVVELDYTDTDSGEILHSALYNVESIAEYGKNSS